jgi:hypothetical protein
MQNEHFRKECLYTQTGYFLVLNLIECNRVGVLEADLGCAFVKCIILKRCSTMNTFRLAHSKIIGNNYHLNTQLISHNCFKACRALVRAFLNLMVY